MINELIKRKLALVKRQKSRSGIDGAIKQVVDVAGKNLLAAVKLAGPLIGTIIPGAGPIIQEGLEILGEAEKGSKAAIKVIKDIQAKAKIGDPKAKKALEGLQASKELQNQVRGKSEPAPLA